MNASIVLLIVKNASGWVANSGSPYQAVPYDRDTRRSLFANARFAWRYWVFQQGVGDADGYDLSRR